MSLRIGVNALFLIPGGVGGTEIYLRNLLPALAAIDRENQYFVFANAETGKDIVPAQANFHWVPQAVRASFRPARILWEQTVLPLAAARLRVDVMLNPGFTAPAIGGFRSVTVFHDVQHLRHPEHFRWFDLPFWKLLLGLAARRSKLLIADSEATRADLIRFYVVRPEKVRVIPLGVEPRFFSLPKRAQEPMILCVSTLHPHKNLDRLVRAFAEFRREHLEFRLVIAGLRGFSAGQLEGLVSLLGLEGAIELTGWIPREELYHLYARAHAFVYPSTFEGFGLPVLEGLAAGIPTCCSNIEPLASIASDAALQFDPEDVEAIRDALTRITCDSELRRALARKGPARAAEFSWERTARLTLEALRHID